MKRVLVICYYFPPCNGAPAWRPYSWAKNFHLHGIRPTILSRHWSGEENTWEDFIKENNTQVISIQTKELTITYGKDGGIEEEMRPEEK